MGTGGWFALDGYAFLKTADFAPGTVIDVLDKPGSRGTRLHHPVVRFQPTTGETVEFTAQPSPVECLFEPGDQVVVAYQPASPTEARIRSFWLLWFLPLAAAMLGLACSLAGWHNYRTRVQSSTS